MAVHLKGKRTRTNTRRNLPVLSPDSLVQQTVQHPTRSENGAAAIPQQYQGIVVWRRSHVGRP